MKKIILLISTTILAMNIAQADYVSHTILNVNSSQKNCLTYAEKALVQLGVKPHIHEDFVVYGMNEEKTTIQLTCSTENKVAYLIVNGKTSDVRSAFLRQVLKAFKKELENTKS